MGSKILPKYIYTTRQATQSLALFNKQIKENTKIIKKINKHEGLISNYLPDSGSAAFLLLGGGGAIVVGRWASALSVSSSVWLSF